jgi:hypothetical protein
MSVPDTLVVLDGYHVRLGSPNMPMSIAEKIRDDFKEKSGVGIPIELGSGPHPDELSYRVEPTRMVDDPGHRTEIEQTLRMLTERYRKPDHASHPG